MATDPQVGRERPFEIKVIALLYGLSIIFTLALFAVSYSSQSSAIYNQTVKQYGAAEANSVMATAISISIVVLAFTTAITLVILYGIWSGKGWGWWISAILAGLGIVGAIIGIASGVLTSFVGLVLDAAMVYFLTRDNTKAYCGVRIGNKEQSEVKVQTQAPKQKTESGKKPDGVIE
jgi:beta-lactamase regulating signal transducer with metallopeptidase domain